MIIETSALYLLKKKISFYMKNENVDCVHIYDLDGNKVGVVRK
jgi:hypothetical protein